MDVLKFMLDLSVFNWGQNSGQGGEQLFSPAKGTDFCQSRAQRFMPYLSII